MNPTPKVYGDPLAGGPVKLGYFFSKPLVIFRIFSTIFNIIVFSTLVVGGWYQGVCIINTTNSDCNWSIFVGVSSLMVDLGMLTTDFVIPHITSVGIRKSIVILDIILACVYSIFWIVTAGVIIGDWWKTPPAAIAPVPTWQFTYIQVAAAFSLISLGCFIFIVAFAVRRLMFGKSELFQTPFRSKAENRNFNDIRGGAVNGAYSNQYIPENEPNPVKFSGNGRNEPAVYSNIKRPAY